MNQRHWGGYNGVLGEENYRTFIEELNNVFREEVEPQYV